MVTARPNPQKRGRGRPRIKLPIRTIAWFYREGATMGELAASWGVSQPTIQMALHDAEVMIRRHGRPRTVLDLSLPDGGIGLSPKTMAYHRRIQARER
jgi:hypothetical protein